MQTIDKLRTLLFHSAVLLVVSTFPFSVFAQSMSEQAAAVAGDDFVRAFLGNCGQNPGEFDRVIAAARTLGFEDLPESLRPLIAPQDPEAEFVGFYAQSGDGAPYVMGVSKSDFEGRSYTTCALANPFIDTKEVVAALREFAEVGAPNHDETSMGQRFRMWANGPLPQGSFISLADAEPMGYGGATLAISAPSTD